jgi:hypothetical protein
MPRTVLVANLRFDCRVRLCSAEAPSGRWTPLWSAKIQSGQRSSWVLRPGIALRPHRRPRKRVLVVQSAQHGFRSHERTRRPLTSRFSLRGACRSCRRARYTGSQRAVRTPAGGRLNDRFPAVRVMGERQFRVERGECLTFGATPASGNSPDAPAGSNGRLVSGAGRGGAESARSSHRPPASHVGRLCSDDERRPDGVFAEHRAM